MRMAHKDRLYSFQCGWEALFDSTAEAIPGCKGWVQNWKLVFADKSTGVIDGSVPFGMSYGEKIFIQITENPSGTSWLGASSNSVWGLFDFGKNSRNLNKLVAGVESALANRGINATALIQQAMPAANAAPPQPLPAPEQAPSPSFCTNCGASLAPGAKFCAKCGNQTKNAS